MARPAIVDEGGRSVKRLTGLAAAVAMGVSAPAIAADTGGTIVSAAANSAGSDGNIPVQLDADQRDGYRRVFESIRAGKWLDARLQLASMKPGPLHSIALAELFTAKGSPKAELTDLTRLLADAPELPESETLARLAKARGGDALPELPYTQALSWTGVAPTRHRARSLSRSDAVAAELASKMQPFVKSDDGASARALLEETEGLTPEAETEWQQKVAWIYYLSGDDANARTMAAKASAGVGEWTVQGDWVSGLAAWRQRDYEAAGTSFQAVASRANDVEFRAAGLFWASRADLAGGHPERIEPRLKSAAQYGETFYGLLSRQSLGIKTISDRPVEGRVAADWRAIGRRPNIRVAAALTEIGENDLADAVLKRQARIGDPSEYPALLRLAAALNLPSTQIWLAHNAPSGAMPTLAARFPAPNWTPDGGWRVDKALVFAHTLQESNFRTTVVSSAGAYGLMQIRPAAASDIARQRGLRADRAALSNPSFNMEIGQSYLETLRDQPATGGLLPKVIAAYNAGPLPVANWNAQVHDEGDPLLYIESIPYWETRGYVITVLRNYWIYERETGRTMSPSRVALAQGLWPRFPGLPGATAVRLSANPTYQAKSRPLAANVSTQAASAN
jgi:soluble lytic murein transglycosylase-like protein